MGFSASSCLYKKTIEGTTVTLLKNCVVGADAHVEDGEEGDDLYGGIAAVVAGRLSVLRIHDIFGVDPDQQIHASV